MHQEGLRTSGVQPDKLMTSNQLFRASRAFSYSAVWIIGLAWTVMVATTLTGCSGGGASGGSPPPGGSSPPKSTGSPPSAPAALTVVADRATAGPLEKITFSVSPVPGTGGGSSPSFTVQVDSSGLGTFTPDNTVEVPGLYSNGSVVAHAPVLEYFQPTPSVSSRFSVRVRRTSDGEISNVIAFDYVALQIPTERRGVGMTVLETLLRVGFESASPILAAQASRINPGALTDSATSLGVDTGLGDIQAEALLKEVFGYVPAATKVSIAHIARSSTARSGAVGAAGILPDSVRAGIDAIFECINDNVKMLSLTNQGSARDCMEAARRAYRDQILPGIADAQSDMAGATSMMSSLFRGRLGRAAGNYAEQMMLHAEMSETAVDFGQFALTLPGVTTTPQEAADYYLGRLTDYGKRKAYDQLTADLSEVDTKLLEQVGAPQAFSSTINWTADQLTHLSEIENRLLGLNQVRDDLLASPTTFGGPAGSTGGSDAPSETIPLGGFGSIEVSGLATPAAVCNAYPQIGTGVAALGFASCEAYVAPFFDKKFVETILQPLMKQIPWDQLQACVSTPDNPSCEALLDRVSALLDDLTSKLKEYGEKDFHCNVGYTEYETDHGSRTCIFAPLAYQNTPCFAGSRSSPFEVGGKAVCVYYSRDYFLPDGSCRENYKKAFFLGTDRCRWSTLPVIQPAAYSIMNDTGDQSVLEP